jgi:ubiquinone/menaquinone biosynthesis C-methylase UbiE
MEQGLTKTKEMSKDNISVIADCGTGTGFATKQATEKFHNVTFIGVDILHGMLLQARDYCKDIPEEVFHVQADTFELPLADESVDVLLAQNTIPCFEEFSRVCRAGGMIIYVDTSAGWITNLAKRMVEKHKLFERVIAERVDMGFYIVAQKPLEATS